MQANYFMEETYEPGQVILEEGVCNPCLYAVAEGRVEVVKGSGPSETVLDNLKVGDIFGEMGLIDGQPASATVRAVEPTRVWLYDEAAFKEALGRDPQLAKKVIDTLVARLRRATDMLQDMAQGEGATKEQVTEALEQHRSL